MKKRKIVHVAAIMLSSLATMATHGKAEETSGGKKEKRNEGGLAKHHHGGVKASDVAADAPRHGAIAKAAAESIKHSKHAVTWSAHEAQLAENPDATPAPALKLDPALMAGAERTPVSIATPSYAPAPLPGDENSRYPWKREIVTTTFWIGESATKNNPVPNRASCWDPNWSKNYGGSDVPETAGRTAEYIPAGFTPGQNPFYVALPYNDMEHGAHKAESAAVIPWYAKEYKGASKSVCKGRWIAIRFGGKICYAQWEDAGPFRTDHWQYVFGTERPKPNLNHGAGLDVSPAVRDFLGMNSSDVTDWKFVDFGEVPSGPWAKFGENNTFVQNSRKTDGQVAQTKAQTPAGLRDLVPEYLMPHGG